MKKHSIVAKKHPVVPRKRAIEAKDAPTPEAEDAVLPARFFGRPFLSFRYSYTEIAVEGGTPRLRSHRARYENGKLESERFEGEIEGSEYERALAAAQRHFAEQTGALLRSAFSLFAPWGRFRSGD